MPIQSTALGGLDANFNLFIPANAATSPVPVLVYLSGLTCTEDNACASCSPTFHKSTDVRVCTVRRKVASSETPPKRASRCSSRTLLREAQGLKARTKIGTLEPVGLAFVDLVMFMLF